MDAHETTRIRLTVHYDGSAFHGWQVQPDQRTVQGDLEAALSRLADRECPVIGSGRTDTGVHATGQVACADLPAHWTPEKLKRSLNAVLPADIWIVTTQNTGPDFHPRYDAAWRTYRYEIGLAEESESPFHRRWCWPMRDRVDRTLLDGAADSVIGEHSFEAFSKAGQPERGYRCRVLRAGWTDTALGLCFTVTADRYLHHMVRYLVGTMIDVGRGRRPLDDMARLLANDSAMITSPPAPPEGLFLHRVEYPGDVPSQSTSDTPSMRSTTPA